MKKSLFVFGVISVTSVAAVAKTIDLDTQIKWNSYVVEAALEQAGFIGSYKAYEDVRLTHERILAELLKRNTFSVRDATAVCLDKCNMSDFLKNGRGQSGKKCPELCTDFADALVAVNNEFTEKGGISVDEFGSQIRQPDGAIKVYSEDKKFYALYWDKSTATPTSIKKHSNLCKIPLEDWEFEIGRTQEPHGVVFETQSNKPIVLLQCFKGEGENMCDSRCGAGKYKHVSTGAISFWLSLEGGGLSFSDMYLLKYEYLEKRASDTRKNLLEVSSVDKSLVDKYFIQKKYNESQEMIQRAKESVNIWDNFDGTKESWEKYEELEKITIPDVSGAVEYMNSMVKAYDVLRQSNGKTIDWSYRVTYSPAEAYREALTDMTRKFSAIDENKIKCSGDCLTGIKGIGRDDIVTCTIGDVTIKYVFDDICQSLAEDWISDPEFVSVSEIKRAKQELQEHKESFNE